jgi:hypothetical protein
MSLRVVLAAVVDDCLTIFCEHFCRKSTDLSWDGEEPSTAEVEEAAPPVVEAAPETQATTEPPATEVPLPEAVVVEGENPS